MKKLRRINAFVTDNWIYDEYGQRYYFSKELSFDADFDITLKFTKDNDIYENDIIHEYFNIESYMYDEESGRVYKLKDDIANNADILDLLFDDAYLSTYEDKFDVPIQAGDIYRIYGSLGCALNNDDMFVPTKDDIEDADINVEKLN